MQFVKNAYHAVTVGKLARISWGCDFNDYNVVFKYFEVATRFGVLKLHRYYGDLVDIVGGLNGSVRGYIYR